MPASRFPRLALFLLAAALLATCGALPIAAADLRSTLKPCAGKTEHLCGQLAVYENRVAASGRQIELNLQVVPAKTPEPARQALFYFAGGPGGSAVDDGAEMAPVFEALRTTHDLVFVDQRGTGGSNRLGCVANGDLEHNLQGYFDRFLTLEQLRTCRAELEKRADLRFYTTPIAMDDLEEVRQQLGYGKVDLVGASYGTRAAQVFMKRHPQSVRSALLLGVVSLDTLLPLTHAPASERAFDMLITACLEDEACKQAFPALRSEYEQLWQRLDAAPAKVEVRHPKSGEKVKIELSRGNFAESIRFYSYNPASGVVLPVLLHRAFLGDLVPFAEQVLEVEPGFRDTFAWGQHLAVTCSEDVPFYPADTTAYSRGTFLGDYRITMQRELCASWPRGEVPADLHEPLKADIPALLMSGGYDPVTPPWMARQVAQHLPRSQHVMIEHGHHGPGGLSNLGCLVGLMVDFVAKGNAEGLDTSCVETMKRPAWVTDYEAWLAARNAAPASP